MANLCWQRKAGGQIRLQLIKSDICQGLADQENVLELMIAGIRFIIFARIV